MLKPTKVFFLAASAAIAVAGCASLPDGATLDQMTQNAVKVGFRDQGIVKVSVLDTDETNRACSATG